MHWFGAPLTQAANAAATMKVLCRAYRVNVLGVFLLRVLELLSCMPVGGPMPHISLVSMPSQVSFVRPAGSEEFALLKFLSPSGAIMGSSLFGDADVATVSVYWASVKGREELELLVSYTCRFHHVHSMVPFCRVGARTT